MVPFPASLLHTIIVFLQRSSAEVTDVGFSLLGVPVIRDGVVFGLSNVKIEVGEGCSAIRSTLSLIITSIVAGHFFLRSVWGKLGIVAVVVPLAIIKNGFRIVVAFPARKLCRQELRHGRHSARLHRPTSLRCVDRYSHFSRLVVAEI